MRRRPATRAGAPTADPRSSDPAAPPLDAMAAAAEPAAAVGSRTEQQGLLLEIDDGRLEEEEEPKKGSTGLGRLRLHDPLHSYQGRRRFVGLMTLLSVAVVLYFGKQAAPRRPWSAESLASSVFVVTGPVQAPLQ